MDRGVRERGIKIRERSERGIIGRRGKRMRFTYVPADGKRRGWLH